MKTTLTLICCLTAFLCQAQPPAQELVNYITFENLKGNAPAYGNSIEQPIGTGAFINFSDRNAGMARLVKLKNSYRWPNGNLIDFSKRASTKGQNGIVDVYTLTNPSTNQEIKLYVDPYKKDSTYYVPEGMIAVNALILEKEIAPILKLIDEINASKDAYTEQKENINTVTAYISKNIGISGFIDRDNLAKMMTDTQAKQELKEFLFASYVINKFYALGKNITSPKIYAQNKMKSDFLKLQQLHPEIEGGNIKINLN